MMPVHDSLRQLPQSADFENDRESDLFHYRLVGIMSCYLDAETLAHCISLALTSPVSNLPANFNEHTYRCSQCKHEFTEHYAMECADCCPQPGCEGILHRAGDDVLTVPIFGVTQ